MSYGPPSNGSRSFTLWRKGKSRSLPNDKFLTPRLIWQEPRGTEVLDSWRKRKSRSLPNEKFLTPRLIWQEPLGTELLDIMEEGKIEVAPE